MGTMRIPMLADMENYNDFRFVSIIQVQIFPAVFNGVKEGYFPRKFSAKYDIVEL